MAGKHVQPGFFDLDDRYAALSKIGDPLARLAGVIDFEPFRYRLEKALKRSDGSQGGRPAYDCVMMFKILVLQALYGLSDDQAEFMIGDRLSFMRFLGLGFEDSVPDAKTIWLFRELLVEAKAIDKLFALFDRRLEEKGYLAMGGQIIDATLVEAPKQRNSEDEKRGIKAKSPKNGEIIPVSSPRRTWMHAGRSSAAERPIQPNTTQSRSLFRYSVTRITLAAMSPTASFGHGQ